MTSKFVYVVYMFMLVAMFLGKTAIKDGFREGNLCSITILTVIKYCYWHLLFPSEILRHYLPEHGYLSQAASTAVDPEQMIDQNSSFKQSLQNDIEAISNVGETLNPDKLSPFMNALESCNGQLLISGVGKAVNHYEQGGCVL